MLQRVYKIGFNRAARIMDQLGEAGIVGPEEGTKPRKVLMTMEEFEDLLLGTLGRMDGDFDDYREDVTDLTWNEILRRGANE